MRNKDLLLFILQICTGSLGVGLLISGMVIFGLFFIVLAFMLVRK